MAATGDDTVPGYTYDEEASARLSLSQALQEGATRTPSSETSTTKGSEHRKQWIADRISGESSSRRHEGDSDAVARQSSPDVTPAETITVVAGEVEQPATTTAEALTPKRQNSDVVDMDMETSPPPTAVPERRREPVKLLISRSATGERKAVPSAFEPEPRSSDDENDKETAEKPPSQKGRAKSLVKHGSARRQAAAESGHAAAAPSETKSDSADSESVAAATPAASTAAADAAEEKKREELLAQLRAIEDAIARKRQTKDS